MANFESNSYISNLDFRVLSLCWYDLTGKRLDFVVLSGQALVWVDQVENQLMLVTSRFYLCMPR